MRIGPVIAAGLVACHLHMLPAAADEAETVATLQALTLGLDQAYADEDVAAIEGMLVPGHVSIAPRYGGAAPVDQQFAAFDALERSHFDYSPIAVELIGPDAALVTFEKSYTGTYNGAALPPRVFVSEIWLKQGDTWRQRLYQETPIAAP